MIEKLLIALTFAAALGAGLIAGVFFAFSTFVMKALGRLPVTSAVLAMQSINIVVINPLFLGVFLGTAVLCVVAGVAAVISWDRPGIAYVIGGAVLYLVGTFLVTMVCNVPLNNSLATLSPDDPSAAPRWADYLSRWTMWNHVRTVGALASMASFILSLRQ